MNIASVAFVEFWPTVPRGWGTVVHDPGHNGRYEQLSFFIMFYACLSVLPGYDKAFYSEMNVLYKFVINHNKNNMCINAACKTVQMLCER